MKHIISILTSLLLTFTSSILSCPTCVGRLDEQTPPFFSSEYESYYKLKPHSQTMSGNKAATANDDEQPEQEQS